MCNYGEHKYSEAVLLYKTTQLSIKDICTQIGVSFGAFNSYLCRNHRDLILKRHNLQGLRDVKLRGKKGQSTASRIKYHDAIVAAESAEYIEYNISQIARIFGLTETGLGNQLRQHYPEIVQNREQVRKRLGIADNLQRGARKRSREIFARAVEMLYEKEMTVAEVADLCGVSYKGLMTHLLVYHKELVQKRERERKRAAKEKIRGGRTGSWTIHDPESGTVGKYAEALEVYRTSSKTVEEIAQSFGFGAGGFRNYLRKWNAEAVVERRGFEKGTDIAKTKRYKKSTAEKYAEAIALLKSSTLSVSAAASKFGLNSEVFRSYLKEHEPELFKSHGMVRGKNGKRSSIRSSQKYAEAIEIFATTSEPLRSIAERLGLVYMSLWNYIHRNFPEVMEKHNLLLGK